MEAAQRLGIETATVFVARSKAQKLIREQVRRLDPSDTSGLEGTP